MHAARTALRRLQQLVPPADNGCTVLAYHLVNGGTDSPVDLPKARFLEHVRFLRDKCTVVGLHDVVPDGPADQVVLTFDDAYANFYEVVWPILQAFELPATLYVPIDFVDGGTTPIRDTTLAPCTWDQLQTMADAGLDIGSHTHSHCDLREPVDLHHEIRRSREVLETRLGHPVRSFCYPRGLYSESAGQAVRRTYDLGTIGGGRRYRSTTPRHLVPRISLRREDTVSTLKQMVTQRFWLEEVLADALRQGRP